MTKFNGQDVSEQFLILVSERFISGDRVIQSAAKVGANTFEDKIKVLTQMRDAVRQVSINHVFRSVQHRDEVFSAILEALSDLEDQLEEELDRKEQEEELHINTKEE